MGHSERFEDGLFQNIPGNKDQHLLHQRLTYWKIKGALWHTVKSLNEEWYFWDLGTPRCKTDLFRITQSSTPWSRRGGDPFSNDAGQLKRKSWTSVFSEVFRNLPTSDKLTGTFDWPCSQVTAVLLRITSSPSSRFSWYPVWTRPTWEFDLFKSSNGIK